MLVPNLPAIFEGAGGGLTKRRRRSVKRDNKGRAAKLLVGKVQKSNDAGGKRRHVSTARRGARHMRGKWHTHLSRSWMCSAPLPFT